MLVLWKFNLFTNSTKRFIDRELLTGNFTPFSSKGLTFQTWKILPEDWNPFGLKSIRSALLNLVELGSGTRKIGPISSYISTHQLHALYFQFVISLSNEKEPMFSQTCYILNYILNFAQYFTATFAI